MHFLPGTSLLVIMAKSYIVILEDFEDLGDLWRHIKGK